MLLFEEFIHRAEAVAQGRGSNAERTWIADGIVAIVANRTAGVLRRKRHGPTAYVDLFVLAPVSPAPGRID
jgi:hypothetical protein